MREEAENITLSAQDATALRRLLERIASEDLEPDDWCLLEGLKKKLDEPRRVTIQRKGSLLRKRKLEVRVKWV